MATVNMRNGHNRIPADVMLEIVSYLGSPLIHTSGDLKPTPDDLYYHTMRSLALVCREYHHHLLPFLFKTIYLYRSLIPNKTPDSPLHFCARFCKSIVDGDIRARTLAKHVRTYIIDGLKLGKQRTGPGAEEDFIFASKAVAFLSNVQELYVSGWSITNDFLAAAASLPPLQVLRLEGCRVPMPLYESLLMKFSTLQVTHLYDNDMNVVTVSDWDEYPLWDTYRSEQLFKHYPLSDTKYLTNRSRTNFYLLNGLASSYAPMDHLEHVKLGCIETCEAYPKALPNFLKRLPALKTLHIEELQYQIGDPEELDYLSRTTYPMLSSLEHLHAHLPALETMIPGSCVSSIGIARECIGPAVGRPVYNQKGPNFWKPYTEAFTKSFKPIISMDVPMDFYTSIHFAKHFPDLGTLTIRPKHWNWYKVSIYDWEVDDADLALDCGPDEVEFRLFLVFCDTSPKYLSLWSDNCTLSRCVGLTPRAS